MMSHLRGRLVSKEFLTPNILLVRLALKERRFSYIPGQYAMLGVPLKDGSSIERPYSIASAPHQQTGLEFLVQEKRGSAVPDYFGAAHLGAAVTIRGPLGGSFKLPPKSRPLHFFAAGCGIAPFRAIMKDLFKRSPKSRVRFSFLREPARWGVIDDELAEWYRACQNFSYSVIHMRTGEALRSEWEWRHVDVGEPSHNELVYLAGGSGFVANLKTHLLKKGFKTKNIITENA
jgi:ferredoxin-NADP reductase